MTMRPITKFFDRLEDRVRGFLSRRLVLYAAIGGAAVVLFWRGVWDFADQLESLGGVWGAIFSPIGSIILSIVVLLGTGLFVSFFISGRIILSGLTRSKKIEEKTETEIREEEKTLTNLVNKVESLEREIKERDRR